MTAADPTAMSDSRDRAARKAARPPRFLGFRISPLTARRLALFRGHRRGKWSLRIFLVLFAFCLCAELVANDRPLLIVDGQGAWYTPITETYTYEDFGGLDPWEVEYDDPYLFELLGEDALILRPLIPYSHNTILRSEDGRQVTLQPPSWQHLMGTDDDANDVLAKVIYGFRLSVLFALILVGCSSVIGVFAGAIQGYFGGLVDLIFQRIIEIWENMPLLYLLIILASFFERNFLTLLLVMLAFSWMGLVGVVRAECLRVRNFDYVRAARAMGVPQLTIMVRHVIPNALVATLTLMPFQITAGVTTLTALDFLNFGLPEGSPSLGHLLLVAKNHFLTAPWLGVFAFIVVALMLSLMTFIGEAVRDAFDPRKGLQAVAATAGEDATSLAKAA